MRIKNNKSNDGLTDKKIITGNKEISQLYHPGEKILETTIKTYNAENKIVRKEIIYDGLKEVIEWNYSELSKCKDASSIKTISEKYKQNSTEFREYDVNCNIIKRTFKNNNTNEIRFLKFEYTYDKEGNWIERKSYNLNGNLYSITKRKISYYE